MDESSYKLRKLVDYLAKIRGRHTELVTVYVPAGYNMDVVRSHLASEADTAGNIKSKTVRTNVVTAIERMLTEMRKYKNTPKNGLVLFSGNVSEIEGKPDYKIFTIEPPEPINVRLYRCDQIFIVEPLQELLLAKHSYGLVVMDHREANLAFMRGKSITIVKNMDSPIAGKMKAGGQSAERFQRGREEEIKHFFKKIADAMKDAYFNKEELRGIIIGGPGPAKNDFYESGYLLDEIHKKIIGIKDVGDTGENGLRELLAKSEELLEKEELIAEQKILNEFLGNMAKDTGLASYGEAEVQKNLENGTVKLLLLSEALPEEKVDKFIEIAKQFGTEIALISEQTQEGVQLKELGGFGAILRYKTH